MKDVSKKLTDAITLLDDALRTYRYCYGDVDEKNKEHQDHLHQLELGTLNYSERAKLATKIRNSRRERRKSKDAVEVLTPLVEYLESSEGVRCLNPLKQVLGKVRQRERYLQTRTYHKRARN